MVGVLLHGILLLGGTERATSSVVLDPGNWSLDNYGQVLVATIRDGKTFTWNAGATNARTIRAS